MPTSQITGRVHDPLWTRVVVEKNKHEGTWRTVRAESDAVALETRTADPAVKSPSPTVVNEVEEAAEATSARWSWRLANAGTRLAAKLLDGTQLSFPVTRVLMRAAA